MDSELWIKMGETGCVLLRRGPMEVEFVVVDVGCLGDEQAIIAQ
jgi:hypothetical protein